MRRIRSVHGPAWTRLIPVHIPWALSNGPVDDLDETNPNVPLTGPTGPGSSATQDLASDPELQERLQALSAEKSTFFHHRVHERRTAGECQSGVGWRALVDVRVRFGHWLASKDDRETIALNGNPGCDG
jgi:hypothetical protein